MKTVKVKPILGAGLWQFTCPNCGYPVGAPKTERTRQGCRCPGCRQRYVFDGVNVSPVRPASPRASGRSAVFGAASLALTGTLICLLYLMAVIFALALARYGPLR